MVKEYPEEKNYFTNVALWEIAAQPSYLGQKTNFYPEDATFSLLCVLEDIHIDHLQKNLVFILKDFSGSLRIERKLKRPKTNSNNSGDGKKQQQEVDDESLSEWQQYLPARGSFVEVVLDTKEILGLLLIPASSRPSPGGRYLQHPALIGQLSRSPGEFFFTTDNNPNGEQNCPPLGERGEDYYWRANSENEQHFTTWVFGQEECPPKFITTNPHRDDALFQLDTWYHPVLTTPELLMHPDAIIVGPSAVPVVDEAPRRQVFYYGLDITNRPLLLIQRGDVYNIAPCATEEDRDKVFTAALLQIAPHNKSIFTVWHFLFPITHNNDHSVLPRCTLSPSTQQHIAPYRCETIDFAMHEKNAQQMASELKKKHPSIIVQLREEQALRPTPEGHILNEEHPTTFHALKHHLRYTKEQQPMLCDENVTHITLTVTARLQRKERHHLGAGVV